MSELYTKTVWINNRTKLSAKNMNHIEDGLERVAEAVEEIEESGVSHTHRNKAILDQITAPFTTVLENKYDSYANKSTVTVSKSGESEVSVQYITIDGVEYKLAGDIAENYEEKYDVSLNTITETGVYKIIDARDVPEGTSTSGILNATKLSNGQTAQDWLSTTNRAVRIFDESAIGLKFYVNDELVSQGEVLLPAGGTYELQGDLLGHIIIGESEAAVNNRTKIILNGVNIQSYDYDSCIEYTPIDSKVVIEVADNSKNYIVVGTDGEKDDDDLGAIHSENNLVLTGVGYLTVINTKGHGIKASELVITGNPYVYLRTNHDAVHGGKLLKIAGGYFEVDGANDAFSGSAGSSDNGRVLILGGTYVINACNEAAFEGKSANGIKRVLNANITFGAGVNKLFNASNANEGFEFKVFEGLNTIVNNSGKADPTTVSLKTLVGPARLTIGTGVEATVIPTDEAEVVIAPVEDTEYVASGDWTGKKLISNPAAGIKVDIVLEDFYHEPTELQDGFEPAPFIQHNGDKRIKFSVDEFKLAYIAHEGAAAILTSKNIQVKGKGDLFIKCTNGEAITAPNGYTVLGGDGIRNITNCASGITTASLRLGEDPDDVDEKFDSTPSKRGVSETAIYIINNASNEQNKDITLTTTEQLITYENQVIATQYMTGAAILGNIVRADYESLLVVQSGEVLQKTGNSYTNTALVYVQTALIDIEGDAHVYEEPSIEELDTEAPDIESSASASWVVYHGDGYSKEDADEKFVAKSTYNALVNDLDARAPRKIDIINFLADDDGIPLKPKTKDPHPGTYADGKIDAIEIFRYACPEQIDIDSTIDQNGDPVLEPETHSSYMKDGRQIYARDGDSGYPEIDGTGQFNFRPVWNTEGYVLTPIVTDFSGKPHDGNEKLPDKSPNPNYNKCYNKFKTPWLTGIPGVHRFTKVCKDIKIDFEAVEEASLPRNTITWNIVAPDGYLETNIPSVRIFRCEDQAEKYFKYYLGEDTYLGTLSEDLISGEALSFIKQETEAGEDQVWETTGITYNNDTGYPEKNGGSIVFLLGNLDKLPEGYTVTAFTDGPAISDGSYGHTKFVEKINDNITITIKVAPPVNISYDDQGNTLTYIDKGKTKVAYGFSDGDNQESAAQGSNIVFTIFHSETDTAHGGYGWTEGTKDPITQIKPIYKLDGTQPTVEDVYPYIASVTVGEVVYTPADAIIATNWKAKKVEITLNAAIVTDDIIIKLAARPGERNWPAE